MHSRRRRLLLWSPTILLPTAFGFVAAIFGSRWTGTYGLLLFCLLPAGIAASTAVLAGWRRPQSLANCLGYSGVVAGLVCLALLAAGFEGAICLLMASPLVAVSVVVGALIGYRVQRRDECDEAAHQRRRRLQAGLIICGLTPLFMGMEAGLRAPAPLRMVETSLTIAATPATVWPLVLEFPLMPEPEDWIFQAGIAYPQQAHVFHDEAGRLIRHCTFDTGAFVEPITALEPERRLAFSVSSQPPPMRHRNPFRTKVPKLDPYLLSERGELVLEPLADGGTRLIGRTWYRVDAWPQWYWTLWSDPIIGRIHQRVLRHVRDCSESAAAAGGGRQPE